VVTVASTTNPACRFVKWTGNVGTISDVNAATTTITMDDDYTITANFVAVVTHHLTISGTEGGSVTSPGDGTFIHDEGAAVDLVASPDGCYHFVSWTGDVDTIADVSDPTTTITMAGDCTIAARFDYTPMVAGGYRHTVGLKNDGTVVVVGRSDETQDDVGGWTDIVRVAAGSKHTVGLKSDGTVVAVGWNYAGECNVGGWNLT